MVASLGAWGCIASGYTPPVSDPRLLARRSVFLRPPTRALAWLSASSAPTRLDELILRMRTTTSSQLSKLVAENIKLIDTSFFLRLAELADSTDDRLEKARLSDLADTVARTLRVAVESTDALADAKSAQAQQIIALLADEEGNFATPIHPDRLAAMRARVRDELGSHDENFVTTLRAFLKKCVDDSLGGMVVVLQKVLQVYASERLLAMSRGLRPDLRDAVSALLLTDADAWDTLLDAQLVTGGGGASGGSASGSVSADEIAQVLKEELAQLVLELPSGSLVQSVVAEYLGEAIRRVDEAAARAEAAGGARG